MILQYIRSILFFIAFTIISLLLSLLSTILFFCPSKVILTIARYWSWATLFFLKYICKIDCEVTGRENIPANTYVIFASKHQSAWETVTYQYLLGNCVFMFKKELAFIPFFGVTLFKSGSILVDRNNTTKSSLKKLISNFKKKLKYRNIVVFPEGTRSLPNSPSQYKSGLSVIANKIENAFVVPIAINSGLYWSKKGFLKKPGTIKVHILPAIPTGKYSRDVFQEKLIQAIENEQNKL